MALSVMLDRIANPDLPPRDILLGCELIVAQVLRDGLTSKAADEIALAER